jgi:hypothetical protein
MARGSVNAARWTGRTGASAPRKSPEGSRWARPVAIAYRNTCPEICRARWAVSAAPLPSIRRNTANSSGAVMSAIGRAPIHGKISRSNRRSFFSSCDAAHCGANFAIHSRAMASKLLADRSAFAFLTALRCSLGSIPLASSGLNRSRGRVLGRCLEPGSHKLADGCVLS